MRRLGGRQRNAAGSGGSGATTAAGTGPGPGPPGPPRDMRVFHGTSFDHSAVIASGGIDVSTGGGEFGRGFYTGQWLHEAIPWAIHKFGRRRARIVEIDMDERDFFALDIVALRAAHATAHRNNIRLTGRGHTHVFDCDAVWGPIVGDGTVRGDQYKFESAEAEDFLNGPRVDRKVRR